MSAPDGSPGKSLRSGRVPQGRYKFSRTLLEGLLTAASRIGTLGATQVEMVHSAAEPAASPAPRPTPGRHGQRFRRCGTATARARQMDMRSAPISLAASTGRTRCTTKRKQPLGVLL